MNIKKFIEEAELFMDCKWIPMRPDANELGWKDCNSYEIMLYCDDRHYGLWYSQGYGIKDEPSLERVLGAILMDCQGLEGMDSFEDWADSYGYDTDSRSAERIYKACQEQADNMKYLLGYMYDDFLSVEEE